MCNSTMLKHTTQIFIFHMASCNKYIGHINAEMYTDECQTASKNIQTSNDFTV